jgi:ABC-type multidrug transport system ATPase subunit
MAFAVRIQDLALAGRLVASRRVSLEIHLGESVGVAGRAGMGKSQLLRILSGQRPAQATALEVLGLDGRREPRRVWEHVGYASGRRDTLLDWRTAADNLRLEASQKGLPTARIEAAVQVALQHYALQRWAGLETGKLQRELRWRLGLAQAMLCGPRLLLLDEPLQGVLSDTAERLLKDLQQWLREDPSHTLVVAAEDLRPFDSLLTRRWRLDERGLQRLPEKSPEPSLGAPVRPTE